MLESILPRSLDEGYRGHPVARVVLVILFGITLARSLVHIFFSDGGAQSIATIPLDTYAPGAAAAVITIFAYWGLSQLLMAFLYGIVLWRYPALIPLAYVLFIAEWAGRLLIGVTSEVETARTPPGAVGNLVFPLVGAAMLYLSLRRQPGKDSSDGIASNLEA
jgi:hypothetical protein